MKAVLLLSAASLILGCMVIFNDQPPASIDAPRTHEIRPVALAQLNASTPHADRPPADRQGQGAVADNRSTEVVELCGLGRYSASHGTVAAGVEALPAPIGSEPLALARERMLTALKSGSPRARAAALLLEPPPLQDDDAGRRWGSALVQLALDSQDPSVLMWAEEGCNRLTEGATCRVSLIRARLRLEPDNAEHWAALAEEDPDAADEAWRGLQRAQRWHQAPQSLLLATQAAVPQDVPGYVRMALAAEANTKAAALPKPGDGFLKQRCADAAARSATCNHLANVMVERSDNVQLLSAGLELGKGAGWPDDRVASLQLELRALGRQSPWPADSGQPLSCGVTDAFKRHLESLKTGGELGALRSLLRGD